MKPVHSALAAACSVALFSFSAHAQTPPGQATQQPSPANSGTQQTQSAAPNAQQTQPVRPDTQQTQPATPSAQSTIPGTDNMEQTSALAQEDQRFLENAIQGSYAEIEGSRLALEKTEDTDVKEFAQVMITDHQKMVDEASTMASEKGVTPPDGPSVMQVTEITALKALTGGAFDAMYVNRIGVAAHESTIEMFEQASQEVQDPDIRAMISETLPKLREHLEIAQALDQKQDNQ